MDRPLLALTRGRPGAPVEPSPDLAAAENMRQLIQLRWIAVAGQLLTILIVSFGLGVTLPHAAMLGVVAVLAAINVAEALALPRHRITNLEMLAALLLDMGALTIQLYLSGGATNPFISLYLLQVVLGAILLETWSIAVLVVATSAAYALLSVRYMPLVLPPGWRDNAERLYLLGDWIGFVLAAVLLVLFIARISRNLRARDLYLADLRQRAAEEDGIVRMGLFASGAAHELGSPLGSLSVILGDWRRLPKIASDPELAGELEEMRGEVERCKAIVSDILHSAGEPRGEAMESRPARAFLDKLAAAWRLTRPGTLLVFHPEGIEDAVLVADPALRQAVWNLLDNAAEASPTGVTLSAAKEAQALVIAVSDEGPGFAPERLAALGKPYSSTKGAGHGVGLFLAMNTARRLGGRLDAANRPKGGAEVRLTLPLAPDRPRKE